MNELIEANNNEVSREQNKEQEDMKELTETEKNETTQNQKKEHEDMDTQTEATNETEKNDSTENEEFDISRISDGTTISIVTEIILKDNGDSLESDDDVYSETKEYIEKVKNGTVDPNEDPIQKGKSLLRRFNKAYNVSLNAKEGVFTRYAIMMGQVLNALKKLVKKSSDLNWEEYASKELRFIKTRTRQDYMLLAKKENVEHYALLGKDRLVHLIRVTKKDDEKIGEFLTRHGIEFDPEKEQEIDKFKMDVDVAIEMDRLKENGLDIDKEKIRKLVEMQKGKPLSTNLLKNLLLIKNTGGNVNDYIDEVHINKGAEPDYLKPEKAIKRIPKLVSELGKSIDSIKKEMKDLSDEQDIQEAIKELEGYLKDLQGMIANS